MPSQALPTAVCPECAAVVPVDPGRTPWCECGWNVVVGPAWTPDGRLDRIYASLGSRHGRELYESVLRDGAIRPTPGVRDVLLIALSALVFASWLAFPAAAVVLAVSGGNLRWFGVALFAGLAWGLRPRLGDIRDAADVTAASHPRLVALVSDVAAAVGAEPPRRVRLHSALNAHASRPGFLRRPTLTIGVPLFVVLEPQELVSVLGHEMGHFVNGDAALGLVTGAAYGTLSAWWSFVADDWQARCLGTGRVLSVVIWCMALFPRLAMLCFVHLAWSSSQRAEYFADRLGAAAGGTGATLTAFGRMLDFDLLPEALHRVVVAKSGRLPLEEFRHQIETLPSRERERRRRAAEAQDAALFDSHPPTWSRIRVLRDGPQYEPLVRLDPAGYEEILRELAPDLERTERRLVDEYRMGWNL